MNNEYCKFINSKKYNEENQLLDKINDINNINNNFIDHLLKNNFESYSKLLNMNLKINDINKNIDYEIEIRKKNLDLFVKSFRNSLPHWMVKINDDNNIFPGIFPFENPHLR